MTNEEIKRKLLFVPCETKEHLRMWIKTYLNLDYDFTTVCDDETRHPPSNSNPLDLLWELYSTAMDGKDPDKTFFLGYSSRDSFKCQVKGTKLISQSRGIINIEDVQIGETIWSGWNWKPVTDWIHDGVKESVKVVLQNGLKVTGSPIHRVWAWEPGKRPDWKKMSDLTDDDLVCVDTQSGWGNTPINQEEYDIGYLCGILQGDGCLTSMDKHNTVALSNGDHFVISKFSEMCLDLCGKTPSWRSARPYDHVIHSKKLVEKLKQFGLKPSQAQDKEIPEICFKSNSYMTGFISGLFDTDGTVTPKGSVEFPITAKKLVEQLLVVFHAMGVNAWYRENELYDYQNYNVHNVIVNMNDVPKMLAIGIKLTAQKAKSFVFPKIHNTHDSIPRDFVQPLLDILPKKGGKDKRIGLKPKVDKYPTISRGKVNDILVWARNNKHVSENELSYWERVFSNKWLHVKKKTCGQADFYDLTVDGDHSYWSNGVISHNTLSCAILEVLCLFHLNRDVAHLAAIESQAANCQRYVENFLKQPILRDFLTSKNKRTIEVTKYVHDDGTILSPAEFTTLDPRVRDQYKEAVNFIQIIVATMSGTNSLHCSMLILDELDLAPPKPVEEAKMIAAPGKDRGELPITFMTSTRKFNYGLVQKAIDEANKTGLLIRHWNLIDISSKCPESRHLPTLPRQTVYFSEDTLKTYTQPEYESLNEQQQEKLIKDDKAYAGCTKNCSMFAMCRGRLATKQKSESKLLKTVSHVQNMFKKVDVETAKAQLLTWKPSTSGLVYPRFDKDVHMITANQMAEMITGEPVKNTLTKNELVQVMRQYGVQFYGGQDYGYSHAFACTVAGVYGINMFVIEAFEIPGLEITQKIEVCDERIKHLDPIIYGDVASISDIKTFKKFGYKMKEWTKDKGSVKEGIDCVRLKLSPRVGEPQLYLLKDDEGCDLLAKRLGEYHWKLDAIGRPSDVPDDTEDDICDAFRYLVMNVFPIKKTRNVATAQEAQNKPVTQNWMEKVVQEHVQGGYLNDDLGIGYEQAVGNRGKRGKLLWDM